MHPPSAPQPPQGPRGAAKRARRTCEQDDQRPPREPPGGGALDFATRVGAQAHGPGEARGSKDGPQEAQPRAKADAGATPRQGPPDDPEWDPSAYVISFCDGAGGAFVAVSHFTRKVKGHACEKEDHLREFVTRRWPQITASKLTADLKVQQLMDEIRKEMPDIVILIGGPPCQPFSELGNNPRGFEDERSAQAPTCSLRC